MKLAIVGSRNLKELDRIYHFISSLPKDTEIVTGGAKGVDEIAEICARNLGLKVTVFKPEYDKYEGKIAPLIRNRKIVDYSDVVVGFWDGLSRGTKHTLKYANKVKEKGKVTVVMCK